MLQYGGYSPYNSVLGLQPAMLPQFEATNLATEDDDSGELAVSRGAVRMRELACQSIVEATAYARLLRAKEPRTRVAGQLL